MIENREMLVTKDETRQKKDARQRLTYFADWMTATNRPWYLPDLDRYRDYLLEERNLGDGSVATHLGSIRTRYEALLEDEFVLNILHTISEAESNPTAFYENALHQMKAATNKNSGRVEYKRQPQVHHLAQSQLNELFIQPNIKTLQGLRDILAIGLIFCMGINEAELCALHVSDFQREDSGELTIHIPTVLEGVERTIKLYDHIFFSQTWVETYLATWLQYCNIEHGVIMRGFFRGGMKMNAKEVTSRGIQKMLKSYLVHDERGRKTSITTLDLRRTYARWLFLSGVDFAMIQESLGHNSSATTLEYIGLPSVGSDLQLNLLIRAESLLDGLSQYWPLVKRLPI